MDLIALFLVAGASSTCFLPAIVAGYLKHHQENAIIALNTFSCQKRIFPKPLQQERRSRLQGAYRSQK